MIPIKNVYHMLSYAWNVLTQDRFKGMELEDFDNIYDMLSSILILGINSQLKRGFDKKYECITESVGVLKGKIEITQLTKETSFMKQKLVCSFDEFSSNSLLNKILKSSCLLLLKAPRLTIKYKKQLRKLMIYFSEVDVVPIEQINWTALKFHRNNATYRMLMNVCHLICKGLLFSDTTGEKKYANFLNDKLMSTLYEKFVLEFYRKEYPYLGAAASHINWKIDDGVIDLLPKMKTDITLTQSYKRLIIDTKYYPKAMQKNPNNDHSTLISGNLYQIFAYVKNSNFTGSVSGMLLYPAVDRTLDQHYKMSGNDIYVRTLNLNADFIEIKAQLESIVKIIE